MSNLMGFILFAIVTFTGSRFLKSGVEDRNPLHFIVALSFALLGAIWLRTIFFN